MDIDLCDIVHAIENGNEEERSKFSKAIMAVPIKHVAVDGKVSYVPFWKIIAWTMNSQVPE